jgi:uncharacterized SAM-binding protein YcdF (DUF218 family)
MGSVSFRTRMAQAVYDFLDVGKGPRLSDCIFVPAGNQERRIYGIKMWRFGYASQLILSVGPFEWQKLSELKLESDGGLQALVSQTPAKKKYFFLRLDRQETSCWLIRGRLSTHSEAKALAEYVRKNPVRSLLIVSSPVHMRRVSLSFRRALGKRDVRLTFVAVPEQMPPDSQIWSEFRRYLLYLLCHL